MYSEIYKCRLCGEKFCYENDKITERQMKKQMREMVWTSVHFPRRLGRTIHVCNAGSYGIADLQGFKKAED